jgi:hypothetical protein
VLVIEQAHIVAIDAFLNASLVSRFEAHGLASRS